MPVRLAALAVVAVVAALGACGSPATAPPATPAGSTTASATASSTASIEAESTQDTTATGTPAPSTTSRSTPPAAAPVVVLDPGHNGGNATHPRRINRQVPAGRGRTKACNTTGTATASGYPEHAFAWNVAVRVRELLRADGVTVVMTRKNDSGVGPCVHRRAAIGNEANAAAVVSIHADGSTDPSAHGFHIAYSAPPLHPQQGAPTLRLARTMRDGLRAAGLPVSTYIGTNGLSPRDDLAGMNLSRRPAVLVECGNMRNPAEAAAFGSGAGRQSYAEAITAGVLAYLG